MNTQQLDAAYKPFPDFAAWSRSPAPELSRWDRESALLADRANSSSNVLDRARLVATRAAAIDTGALENLYEADRGFTYSVAFETTGWELQVAARGEQVRPLFEAQLKAYEYVLTLATGSQPVSEAAIRELHVQICAAQPTYRVETPQGPREQPLPKGVYKALPNHVRTRRGADHAYAPVDVTPMEMHRLVTEMRSEAFLAAHPLVQAAYVHYAFVVIHPFADGNGRVARALASVYTYRAISVPIVIFTEQKTAYLDALEAADAGDFSAFATFMCTRSLDTVELVMDSLSDMSSDPPENLVADILSIYERPVLTRSQVDAVGRRLLSVLIDALKTAAAKLGLEGKIEFQVLGPFAPNGVTAWDREYRMPGTNHLGFVVVLKTSEPASAKCDETFVLWLPRAATLKSEIHIRKSSGKEGFAARIEHLEPTISPVIQLRAILFAERQWSMLLRNLKPLAESALKAST